MATSPKDKFDAAVKVIRGLPKNGSFQPSHELMLKFYSYFKQATEGPCMSAKPGFWDVVNRKKWEAWAKLGSMEAEEAMLLYVDELKNIVETMPQTDDVSEFLQKLDHFYEMVEDSDNHNSLKVYVNNKDSAKSLDNGDHDDDERRLSQHALGSSLNEGSSLDHSGSVNQLLQQDLQWWQNSSGVIRVPTTNGGRRDDESPTLALLGPPTTNGILPTNGTHRHHEDDNDDIDAEDGSGRLVGDGCGTGGTESTEDWEELEARASNSGSHSGHSGSVSESEEENEEEFCDTSDEPVENTHQPQETEVVMATQQQQTMAPGSADGTALLTSTPMKYYSNGADRVMAPGSVPLPLTASAKSVHFEVNNPATPVAVRQAEMSDSLVVNPSPYAGSVHDLSTATFVPLQEKGPLSSLNAEVGAAVGGRMDIFVCRGGEADEIDRERRGRRSGGGGSARDAAGMGRGDGYGTSSNSDSRRGLFPGSSGGGAGGPPGGARGSGATTDMNEQIVVTLLRLQHDMSGVLNRLNSLEALVKEGRAEKERRARATKGWWPLSELSPKSALVIFGWPILLQVVLFLLSRRRRRHTS